ncbi:hypothetical protein M422DRAFT_274268 [Sphaerobolus stellatus SS14]|uniref:Uncharacterized protein n=1 Tax=Sphaerobolus stellatus (strain SS14) TaxID=990650 RepID=A0A0C9T7A1_SPHS4|nr:hypothetical protein M422DRAFT_274268 [Sphaerobolus stellatus SS14]
MSNPENGECAIDLGISASPEPEQPMVGLWNLTNVDAFFAQAATNTPSLFNDGTLADYGAVSAEYPIDHAEVIQMRYHMAYNLIFEIVCGNIQFPENSDAYAANGTFHACINQIINLYTDAKQSSYGVREELQASIQTVRALLPVAKQKMAAYVNVKTVIWIPSRIYFAFWIRHKKTGINSQPWRYHPEKGGPSFIVNAKAYKICGVDPPKKNTNIPHPRALATHTRIEALLLADNLNISFNDASKHIKGNNCLAQKQDRHSAKHKNQRKPPQKIQRSQGSSASENQEIQPEHLEEDSEEVNGDSIQEEEQDYSEEGSDYLNIESDDSEDV